MEPEYVTETAERKSEFFSRAVMIYNMYPGNVHYEPREDFPELCNLSVHDNRKRDARNLVEKFYGLGPNPERSVALPIIKELVGICEVPYDDLSNLGKWGATAVQFPGDIGGMAKKRLQKIVGGRCKGKVLEAMAGFNSYVADSSDISEVVAMDYSKKMLMKYPYPERDRIVFDLNRISSEGVGMDFFEDGRFDTVSCCYGVNYLKEPVSVFREFGRILTSGGKFLVLGNTGAGYSDIQERRFDPNETLEEMRLAGFNSFVESFPELESSWEAGDYYLVSGIRGD